MWSPLYHACLAGLVPIQIPLDFSERCLARTRLDVTHILTLDRVYRIADLSLCPLPLRAGMLFNISAV